jgi:hypothetical protein
MVRNLQKQLSNLRKDIVPDNKNVHQRILINLVFLVSYETMLLIRVIIIDIISGYMQVMSPNFLLQSAL